MVTTLSPTESQEAQCPECGSTIRVAGRRRRVQCPKCREIVTLSTPEPEKRPGKPSPPVAAVPNPGAEPAPFADPGRLAALEARLAALEALESAKLRAPGTGIESERLKAQRQQLEAHASQPDPQSAKLTAIEARIRAMEQGMQAAPESREPAQPEGSAPEPASPPLAEKVQEPPPQEGATQPRPAPGADQPEPTGENPIFGKTIRIASPDELENPIPGLPPLSRIAKSAGVPPGRMRWLAPGESHAPGISPAQEAVLIHNLRNIPGQQITIRTIPGNTFSRLCAEAFRGIFERAGWTVHGVEEIPRAIPEPGLSLAVPTLPVEQEAAATYLALKAAGFSPAIVLDTALASGAKEDAAPLSLTLGPAKTA